MPRSDILNKTINQLTPIEYLGNSKYLCRCSCGNFVKVRACNINNGHTKSCGCINKKQSPENGRKSLMDLTNRQFGNLKAIEYDTTQKKWKCQCKCGNICYIAQNNLIRKNGTKSCGCLVTLDNANKANIVKGTNVGNIKTHTALPTSSTGIRGVFYSKSRKRYIASIGFQGKQYILTTSKDIQPCIEARQKSEKEIFGEFLEWYENYKNSKNNSQNP